MTFLPPAAAATVRVGPPSLASAHSGRAAVVVGPRRCAIASGIDVLILLQLLLQFGQRVSDETNEEIQEASLMGGLGANLFSYAPELVELSSTASILALAVP